MKSAVHHLETHPDHVRIQKLLYFVYTKLWISDVQALDGLSITRLLNLLMDESSSIQQLELRLIENAERLNKPETYIQLAQTIIATLHPDDPSDDQKNTLSYDRFQLRYAIMQVLNPWKAKAILIALYYVKPQSSAERPVPRKTLEKVSLDELLRKILDLYPSVAELDSGLQQLQHGVVEIPSDEMLQLGQTLKEVLRPYLLTHRQPVSDDDLLEPDPDSLCTILMSPGQRKAASFAIGTLACREEP